MAACQIGLEQTFGLGPLPGLAQQVRPGGDHRLAFVAVTDFAVVARHLGLDALHQGAGQWGMALVLGHVDACQGHPRGQRAEAVGTRQAGVGLEPLQGRIKGAGQRQPLDTGLGCQGLADLAGVVDHHVHLRPRCGGVGQQAAHALLQRGVGLDALALVTAGQRLEQQPHRRFALARRAGAGELRQQARALGLADQLRLVDVPAVIGQRAPLIAAHRLACQRVGQHRLHRPAAGQAQLQHPHHLRRVGLAGQTGDLGAVGAHQDHGGIAPHLEAPAQLLCARQVTVDVDGHKALRAVDKVGAVEQRGLELVAGRAPFGAPVQQQRLLL